MFTGYYTEQNFVLSATHSHSGPTGRGTKKLKEMFSEPAIEIFVYCLP